MSELRSIIETVKNQAAGMENGCLSMRSERLLVDEIERLQSLCESTGVFFEVTTERRDEDPRTPRQKIVSHY